jgi:hypothetical protein
MVIQVAAQDPERAGWLVREFVRLFGGERVSGDAGGEVEVQLQETNGAIEEALDAVERWLEATQLDSARVSVDGHSYKLERSPVTVGTGQPRTQRLGKDARSKVRNGERFIRQVNNSVCDVLLKLGVEDGEFWCECDDPSCERRVVLTLREYVALRDRDGEALLCRSHGLVGLPQ